MWIERPYVSLCREVNTWLRITGELIQYEDYEIFTLLALVSSTLALHNTYTYHKILWFL